VHQLGAQRKPDVDAGIVRSGFPAMFAKAKDWFLFSMFAGKSTGFEG
jgi:hypothetical protein